MGTQVAVTQTQPEPFPPRTGGCLRAPYLTEGIQRAQSQGIPCSKQGCLNRNGNNHQRSNIALFQQKKGRGSGLTIVASGNEKLIRAPHPPPNTHLQSHFLNCFQNESTQLSLYRRPDDKRHGFPVAPTGGGWVEGVHRPGSAQEN